MDTLVDGTHFKQRLFGAHAADQERLELEGRAAGTRAGEQEGDSAPPTLQAHTRGRAASVRSNDSSNSTGSAGASSVITHVSAKAMYEQVIADVHRTVEESGWRHVRDGGGSPTYAGKAACLRLLQLRTCPLLLQRSLNRSVDPAKRRAASEALIKLVACSNTMLGAPRLCAAAMLHCHACLICFMLWAWWLLQAKRWVQEGGRLATGRECTRCSNSLSVAPPMFARRRSPSGCEAWQRYFFAVQLPPWCWRGSLAACVRMHAMCGCQHFTWHRKCCRCEC